MFRLAELYLNFAEAAYRAHGADWQAPATEVLEMEEGDDGETVEKLNTYGTPMSAREGGQCRASPCRDARSGRRRRGPGCGCATSAVWSWLSRSTASSTCAAGRRRGETSRRPTGVCRVCASRSRTGRRPTPVFSFDRQSYTSKFLKYPVSLDEVRKMLSLTGEKLAERRMELT